MAGEPAAGISSHLFPDRFKDEQSSFPRRALSWAHAVREALAPAIIVRPLSLIVLGYAGLASWQRGQRAAQMERHPELIRKAGAAAAIDSAATLWLECITLPSIAISVVKRAALASGVGASVGVSLAALPLILPACAFGADGLMQWAFRPAIAYWREPSETLLFGEGADYVPAPTDEMLAAIGARGGGGDALLLQGLLPPDMDPLERAQLEWALDGDASSTFPDASDALEVLSAQRAKKRAAAGAVPSGGAFSGSGGEVGTASGAVTRGDAVYMLATARLIRERAAARAAAAAAKEGGGVAGLTGGKTTAASSAAPTALR